MVGSTKFPGRSIFYKHKINTSPLKLKEEYLLSFVIHCVAIFQTQNRNLKHLNIYICIKLSQFQHLFSSTMIMTNIFLGTFYKAWIVQVSEENHTLTNQTGHVPAVTDLSSALDLSSLSFDLLQGCQVLIHPLLTVQGTIQGSICMTETRNFIEKSRSKETLQFVHNTQLSNITRINNFTQYSHQPEILNIFKLIQCQCLMCQFVSHCLKM